MTGWVRRLGARCLQHRALTVATALATLGAVAADLVTPLFARAAIDHATGASPARVALSVLVLALLIAAAIRYACQFGRRLLAGKLSIVVQDGLRRSMLDTLLHLDGRAQDSIRTGQVVSRSIADLQVVQSLLALAPLALGGAVQVVIALAIMAWLSPVLTLVALMIVPLVALVAYRGRRRLFAATWAAQQAAADLAGHVEETVTGVRVVKGFGQEQRATDELAGLGARLYRLRLRAARLSARFTPTMAAIPQLGTVLVIGVGGWLTLRGSITAGTFLAFTTYLATMTAVARILTNLVTAGQLAASSTTRVFEVIDHPRDPALLAVGELPEGRLGLHLNDVAFGHDGRPVLRGVDLSVAPGECVAVVGGAGSGKSTLAALLAGGYHPDAGSLAFTDTTGRQHDLAGLSPTALHTALAVAFDDPFLTSDSVAANVAFGPSPPPPPDAGQLRAATDPAAATGFIEQLPDGFATGIGERGLTLSGGQRQRLALARACYAEPRVLVLDDATSAVDAVTEAQILRHLRSTGTTMLLMAHRRSTLAVADRVAVLDDGRIVDIGTVDQLDARCARFRELMTPPDTGEQNAAAAARIAAQDQLGVDDLWPSARVAGPAAARPAVPVTEVKPGGSRGRVGGGNLSNALGAVAATPELEAAVAALPPADEDPRVDLAAVRRDDGGFSLRQILRPVRWLLAAVLIAVSADTLLGLAFPALTRLVLDAGTRQHGQVIVIATVAGLAAVAAGWVVGAIGTLLSARAGERVLYALRVRSYAHLQRLGLDYYERELSGRIMTRMTTDVDALSGFIQTGLTSAAVAVLTVIGVFVALLLTDWQLGLLVLPVFPVLALATVWFRRISSRAYTRSRELVSAVNADFQENIAGLATIRAYRHTAVAQARFGALSDAWVRSRLVSARAVAAYFPFIMFCADVAAAMAIGIGAQRIATGQLSAGTLVAFVLYLAMLFGPVQQLTNVFDAYQQAAVGLRRIGDLLETPSSLSEAPSTGPGGNAPRPSGDSGARVGLAGVGFRYSQAPADALHGIDLDLAPGTSLALVGPTGAGKSTIVKLLARFYDPVRGTIRFNGDDLRGLDLHRYRRHLGLVPQEAHLFAGTVAENIAYGRPDATPEEIAAAARRVGAAAMIADLPAGMDFVVSERGRSLSSGQRQLIALARAELVDPDLILLDEATATLDQATEAQVLAAGTALQRRRTAVIVAHRLATAARADRIAVVTDGTIAESGTHDELLAAGGVYARLWAAGVEPDTVAAE
ncbi:putative ABC transporter permease/ATP-binding protein [Gordonia hirsuta DSM 44140 = NBRC 16056]|uniref:Putative ABC transporter permease/ATP-binding protein n=1 Tax=Gordonia hirsuta DSM 44140 = NBRC 16056 TaxID=1121927 RepID=L7L6K0_9ACTN|nr:ABC transporter ATP-binding protein [Gordonia hirsuta]GAC56780.1 putative ABC transporter permease/ATP-binding protein [Gordonia hirsuta DSM 44140 = NBRC 16056]